MIHAPGAVVALAVLVSCAGPSRPEAPSSPPPRDAVTAKAPPVDEDVDRGVFVWMRNDAVVRRETFSIHRTGDRLVIRSSAVGERDPTTDHTEGELEVDLDYHPIRAAYFAQTQSDGRTYRLGGSPLTLDITYSDGHDADKIVAPGPVDVYVSGLGVSVMTALCRVRGEVAYRTVAAPASTFEDFVVAYEGAAVDGRRRVVTNAGFDFELLCDGDRIVAGGIDAIDTWILREGHDADLAALRAAPRPPARKWVHPVVESAPWTPLLAWVLDGKLLITSDTRKWQTRLTVHDLVDGKELAHRDFPVRDGMMCAPATATMLCRIEHGDLRVLDGRTLADQRDVSALLREVAPDTDPVFWQPIDGAVVAIDAKTAVDLDLATGTGKRVKLHERSGYLPGACVHPVRDVLTVGKTAWSLKHVTGEATTQLVRKKGRKQLSTTVLDLSLPHLRGCGETHDRPYLFSNDHDNKRHVVTGMTNEGAVQWTSENLGGYLDEAWQFGGALIVTMKNESLRAVALDAETGEVQWRVVGPQPK